jgi:hypothetical protein
MSSTPPTTHEQKGRRDEYPSGWLVLTRHESVAYIIDALLDLPPHREFNQKELASHAGVSRKSVGRHIELLADAGVVEGVPNTAPTRYRFDPESDVSKAIIMADGAMNAVGPAASGT